MLNHWNLTRLSKWKQSAIEQLKMAFITWERKNGNLELFDYFFFGWQKFEETIFWEKLRWSFLEQQQRKIARGPHSIVKLDIDWKALESSMFKLIYTKAGEKIFAFEFLFNFGKSPWDFSAFLRKHPVVRVRTKKSVFGGKTKI